MMKKCRITIEGTRPLIVHADNIKKQDELEKARSELKKDKDAEFKAGDDRFPAWTWQIYLHTDGEYVCIPAAMLSGVLRKCGYRIVKSGKVTYKSASQSSVIPVEEFAPIIVGENGTSTRIRMEDVVALKDLSYEDQEKKVLDLGFELDIRRLPIGKSKHVRVRPVFDEWSVEFEVYVDEESIPIDVLRELLEIAGEEYGFGDHRPSAPNAPGAYGKFKAKVEVIK